MRWLLSFFLIVVSYSYTNAYSITVDAYKEECFFERVEFGTKMALTFEIAEGGFLDIDVTMVGPDGKIIYQVVKENNGKHTSSAHTPGAYTYCFINKEGSKTPKEVMFTMETISPQTGEHAMGEGNDTESSKHNQIDDMIKKLSTGLWGVKTEQEYMQVRDRNHRAISESTNVRVVMWSFFEALVLVCMTLGQIYYLKRFFEVRRVV